MAQLEKKAAEEAGIEGNYESSEPTSMTNSSTVEGEHTIQNLESEAEELASEEDDSKIGRPYGSENGCTAINNALDTSLSSNNVDSSHSSIQEPSEHESNDGRKNKMGDAPKLHENSHLFESAENSDATTTPATTPGTEDKLLDFEKDIIHGDRPDDIQLLKLRLEEVSLLWNILVDIFILHYYEYQFTQDKKYFLLSGSMQK